MIKKKNPERVRRKKLNCSMNIINFYYNKSNPKVSDKEYDELKKRYFNTREKK